MRTDLGGRAARIRHKDAPAWLRPILEVPLDVKLLGANLIIVGVASLLLFGPVRLRYARLTDAYVVVAALTLGATVNFVLVRLALSPIKAIERVATRISQGMLGERVPASIVADRQLARLSTTINEMLDSLAVGRERMEQLAASVETSRQGSPRHAINRHYSAGMISDQRAAVTRRDAGAEDSRSSGTNGR